VADRFHGKPFDEGTLTKLDIFELYAREWLPVFLSQSPPKWREVHVFDFFAGPGQDSIGIPGSPLRLIRQLRSATKYRAWGEVAVHLHLFDEDAASIAALEDRLRQPGVVPSDVRYSAKPLEFGAAFQRSLPILNRPGAGKLVFIDQFGVDQVDDDKFRRLVRFPACDFLFFISSSTLHRFRDHPAIKQKIQPVEDYNIVHRAVVDYYRNLVPGGVRYFLAPFSLKKGANIWGIIFGSAHPLGMDKFLRVAWEKDQIAGEANFDIHGDSWPGLFTRTKVEAFQDELDAAIRSGEVCDERDALLLVFRHGVRAQHAERVLKALRQTGVIECSFRVPQVDRFDDPRPIRRKSDA
jgi:three-Cys-motif partner protein